MRTFVLLLVVAMGLCVAGCVMPAAAVNGMLVTSDVKGPVAVGDPGVGMGKVGTAEATGIIFFASGDASIKKAMENGGITKIHHVDNKVFQVLGLYARYTTVVYGE